MISIFVFTYKFNLHWMSSLRLKQENYHLHYSHDADDVTIFQCFGFVFGSCEMAARGKPLTKNIMVDSIMFTGHVVRAITSKIKWQKRSDIMYQKEIFFL